MKVLPVWFCGLRSVNHMHQRMARQHGDLSADVRDPVKDWNDKGVTYQAFQYVCTLQRPFGILATK